MSGRIIALDPDNLEHVRAAASLHRTLLESSPVAQLGSLFMERFYYSSLVKDDLICCVLYVDGGEYIGFLSYTKHPYTFMSEGPRRHTVCLAAILALSILAKPTRLKQIWATIRNLRMRRSSSDARCSGEFLSFGVLPDHVARKDAKTGSRVSNLLFDHGMEVLRHAGFNTLSANIGKHEVESLLFYSSYGATFEETPLSWPVEYRATLDLQGS